MAMSFDMLCGKYTSLVAQRNAGSLTPEQFTAAVQALRVLDGSGRWWTLDPTTGGCSTSRTHGRPADAAAKRQTTKALMTQKDDAPRLNERQQRLWSLASVAGGFTGAVIWLIYSGLREG